MTVVDFPQEEKVWECSCGCQVFYIVSYSGNYVQCAECDGCAAVIMTPVGLEEASNDG